MSLTVRKILNASIPGSMLFVTACGHTAIVAPSRSDEAPFYLTICEPTGMASVGRRAVSRTTMVKLWESQGISSEAECEEIVRSFPEDFAGFEANPALKFLPHTILGSSLSAHDLYLLLSGLIASQSADKGTGSSGVSISVESKIESEQQEASCA